MTGIVCHRADRCAQGKAEPEAAIRCRVEVQGRLKAPTSASFQSEDVRYDDAKGVAMVIGAVDAQNSFGAKIRSRYVYELSRAGDNWVTNKIVFEQR
jgi:hypothetical protein